MNTTMRLTFGLFAAALFVSAGALIASAQILPPSIASPVVVSLTSFAPDPSQFLNPEFPVSTTLRHSASGSPTHYRFSRFSDFRDATWLAYTPAPVAQIPGSWFETFTPSTGAFNRRVVLNFQVRATNPKAGRPISRITDPLTGKTTVKTEPAFLNSNTRSTKIFAGFAQ